MGYNGTVTNLFPPINTGGHKGAGMIDGDTGTNLVFQTPGDNNGQELTVGQAITYELNDQGQISSVAVTADVPPHR